MNRRIKTKYWGHDTDQFEHGHALIIGIAQYNHTRFQNLKVVQKDAESLAKLLKNPAYCGYPPEQVCMLLNSDADKIRAELDGLANRINKSDTVIVFFSGHGVRTDVEYAPENYLIANNTDPNDLKNSAISSTEFTEMLNKIQAGRLLVLLDCCHAGGIGEPKSKSISDELTPGLDDNTYETLGNGNGRVLIASCTEEQESWILPGDINSLFTKHLLLSLSGENVRDERKHIRIFDIFDYLSKAIPQAEKKQTPVFKSKIEDNFPVALATLPAEVQKHEIELKNEPRKIETPQLPIQQIQEQCEYPNDIKFIFEEIIALTPKDKDIQLDSFNMQKTYKYSIYPERPWLDIIYEPEVSLKFQGKGKWEHKEINEIEFALSSTPFVPQYAFNRCWCLEQVPQRSIIKNKDSIRNLETGFDVDYVYFAIKYEYRLSNGYPNAKPFYMLISIQDIEKHDL